MLMPLSNFYLWSTRIMKTEQIDHIYVKGGRSRPLQVLTALLLVAKVALAIITVAGFVRFVVPTMTGDAAVWVDGEVSGLAVDVGDKPREIGTAKTVAERFDLPGTNNRGRFIFDATFGSAEVDADFQPARFAYADPTALHRLVTVLGPILTVALLWVALTALARTVRSCREGEPFAESNLRNIRLLGTVALVYQAGLVVVPFVVNQVEPLTLGLSGLAFRETSTVSFHWLFVGAACFALAEVFTHGRHLHLAEMDTI